MTDQQPPLPDDSPGRPEPPWYKTAPWYAWVITAALLAGIIGAAVATDEAEESRTASERVTTTEQTTTTERPTTTTERPRTTTTEPPTTTERPTTTTEATTTTAPAPTTTVLPDDGDLTITADTLTGPWPFTVDEGVVACEDDRVTFRADGDTWAVNGSARTVADANGWRDITDPDSVWADDPADPELKIYVGEVIDLRLALCEAAD